MNREKENITVYQPKTLAKAKELFEKFKQMGLENLDEKKFFFLFEKGNGDVGFCIRYNTWQVCEIPSPSTTVNIFDLDKPEITEELLNQKEQDLRALLEEANKSHKQGSLAAVEYLKRFDELPELRDNPEWKERVQKLFQEFAEQTNVNEDE